MKRYLTFRRNRAAIRGEMRQEVEEHIALAAERLLARGVEREEAWRRARERFGDFDAAMQALYQSAENREGMMRRREYWNAVRQDLTVSLRQMRRSPVAAVAISITLALGIGANLVMFGIANRLLLSPPTGTVNADRLRLPDLPQGRDWGRSTTTNYMTYQELSRAKSFSSVGGYGYTFDASLDRGPRAERISIAAASATFFTTLGVRPVAGRLFLPEEDRPPRGLPVAVIGAEFWQRKFGRDSSAIGAMLPIGQQSYRVVGVLPEHFTGLDIKPVDVWLPLTDQSFYMNPDYLTDDGSKWMMTVVRLAPGVSPEQALAEVNRLLVIADPDLKKATIPTADLRSIIPGRDTGRTGEAARVSIWLVGVAAIVLLIACANVATLLLVRAMRRTPELAVRLALGVSRARLMASLAAESGMLALLGGVLAVVAAYLARGVIQSVLLPDTDLGPVLSLPVLVLGAGIVALICLLTGIAPALQVNRVDLATALKGASGTVSDSRSRLRGTLLVAQVAMSALLLVGAGLFVRSLHNAEGKRLGIDMDRVLRAEVAVSRAGYDFEQSKQYWNEAVRRVRTVPGVETASIAYGYPLGFSLAGRMDIPGMTLPKLKTGGPYRNAVDAQFFATMGSRIVRGRGITDADLATSQPVLVINESLAKAMAPVGEPVGKCVRIWRADTIPCATIVGVVEDITRNGVKEEPSLQYYVPLPQWRGPYSLQMQVRARRGQGERLIGPITKALQDVASDIPFPRVRTYEQIHAPELRSWRLGATMFTLFGALALVVSVVGLYGLLAYSVAQRQHEFGIRTALGAQARDIVGIVLKSGLALVTVGLVVGLAIAAAAARYLGPMLYDVRPRDTMVYAGSAVLMLLATTLVAAVPARRASGVSPTVTLRGNG